MNLKSKIGITTSLTAYPLPAIEAIEQYETEAGPDGGRTWGVPGCRKMLMIVASGQDGEPDDGTVWRDRMTGPDGGTG